MIFLFASPFSFSYHERAHGIERTQERRVRRFCVIFFVFLSNKQTVRVYVSLARRRIESTRMAYLELEREPYNARARASNGTANVGRSAAIGEVKSDTLTDYQSPRAVKCISSLLRDIIGPRQFFARRPAPSAIRVQLSRRQAIRHPTPRAVRHDKSRRYEICLSGASSRNRQRTDRHFCRARLVGIGY